ncbi:MAG: hypothetical protein BWY68_00112 [bacterium ADurb.Bin400]|nr:MAG: hypothetical protein BWY68_00112 [bacterium ADurb.Bin400]
MIANSIRTAGIRELAAKGILATQCRDVAWVAKTDPPQRADNNTAIASNTLAAERFGEQMIRMAMIKLTAVLVIDRILEMLFHIIPSHFFEHFSDIT